MDVFVNEQGQKEIGVQLGTSNYYVLEVLFDDGSLERVVYERTVAPDMTVTRIIRNDEPAPQNCELPRNLVHRIYENIQCVWKLPTGYIKDFATASDLG